MLRRFHRVEGAGNRVVASVLILKVFVMRFLTFIIILLRNYNIQAADKMQYMIGSDIFNLAKSR